MNDPQGTGVVVRDHKPVCVKCGSDQVYYRFETTHTLPLKLDDNNEICADGDEVVLASEDGDDFRVLCFACGHITRGVGLDIK